MRVALEAADVAVATGEVPIGAVVVLNGEIVSVASNRRIADSDPTAHAEILALKEAGRKLGRWNLNDCELYVTLEPCAMCAGAAVNARISRIFFGAYDTRFGSCGSVYDIASEGRLNHTCIVQGGVLEEQCRAKLQDFFRTLRDKK